MTVAITLTLADTKGRCCRDCGEPTHFILCNECFLRSSFFVGSLVPTLRWAWTCWRSVPIESLRVMGLI